MENKSEGKGHKARKALADASLPIWEIKMSNSAQHLHPTASLYLQSPRAGEGVKDEEEGFKVKKGTSLPSSLG